MESAATSVADRLLTGFCGLAQMPLAVGCLGNEGYGLWMILSAVVAAMTVADFGLSIGLQNRLATAFGHDNHTEVRQAWKTGTLMLAAIGLSVAVIILPVCWFVDWASLFKVVNPALVKSTPLCLAILTVGFCLGLPLTTAHRLALAVQLGWMANIKSSLQAVITLALVAMAALLHLSLASFLLVIALPPAIANLLLLIALRKKLGWQTHPAPPFSKAIARQISGKNLLFIIPQLGSTALTVVPPMLLASVFGPAAATPLAVMQRVLSLPPQFQQMFLNPLWPAYTEANARGDLRWVRATYRKSLWLSLVVAVLPTLSFIFWGRWVVSLLGKQSLDSVDQWVLIASCVWTAVQAFSFPVATLLNANGWVVGQSIYGTVSVFVSLGVMPAAIHHFGTAGVPLSMILGFGPLSLPLTLWEANYHLLQRERAAQIMCAAGT